VITGSRWRRLTQDRSSRRGDPWRSMLSSGRRMTDDDDDEIWLYLLNQSSLSLTPEIDYNKMAMSLPPVTSAVFLLAN
jgi:hypothetical protein